MGYRIVRTDFPATDLDRAIALCSAMPRARIARVDALIPASSKALSRRRQAAIGRSLGHLLVACEG